MALRSLILLRHGESESNAAQTQYLQGAPHDSEAALRERHTADRRLSAKGVGEARRAGVWLAENWFRADAADEYCLFVSPYVRAIETAGHLGFGADWRLNGALVERDLGDFEHASYAERGQLRREINARPGSYAFYWRPPHGESYFDLCDRARELFRELEATCHDKNVLLVCHGDLMLAWRVMLEHWRPEDVCGWLLERDERVRIFNCRLIEYDCAGGAGAFTRVRSIDPTDTASERNIDWRPIERPAISSAELLGYAERFDRFL